MSRWAQGWQVRPEQREGWRWESAKFGAGLFWGGSRKKRNRENVGGLKKESGEKLAGVLGGGRQSERRGLANG